MAAPALIGFGLGALGRAQHSAEHPITKLGPNEPGNEVPMLKRSDRLLVGDYSLSAEDAKTLHGLIQSENQFRS